MSTSDISTSNTAEVMVAATSSELPGRATTPVMAVMDPDGDLILRVGANAGPAANITDFKVDSAALRRTSPVFKAMLYGPWTESKPQGGSDSSQWRVSLPDDDAPGMQVILDIVHGNFDDVSDAPIDLYHILGIADKYDMLKCLRPWAATWRKELVRDFDGFDKPYLVHAAWEMGDESSYVTGLRDLVMHSCLVLDDPEETVSQEDDATDHDHPSLWFRRSKEPKAAFESLSPSLRLGPPDIDIAEVIKEYRLKYIQELLDFFHSQVSGRTAPRGHGSPNQVLPENACPHSESDLCDTRILGNIWRGMLRSGRDKIFPKLAEEVPEESIHSLLSVLGESFSVARRSKWPGPLDRFYQNHEACSPQPAFEEIANRLWSRMEWRNNLLRNQDREHLARRRKILGLDGKDLVIDEDQEVGK